MTYFLMLLFVAITLFVIAAKSVVKTKLFQRYPVSTTMGIFVWTTLGIFFFHNFW